MESRRQHTQRVAAARAGISERSARRIDRDPSRGGDRPERHWRTRGDPLAGVWETELVPLLEATPALKAVTLLEALEARHPDTDWRRHRRTLERRVRGWRAQHGPAQEVVFRQKHPPGRLGLSDFTVADDLGVTIAGVAFPHRLYHFTLAFSQWQHAEVITGGESYVALAEGLQNALWALGGAPAMHRSDSLSAAYRNLDADGQRDLTERYDALCRHYAMQPSRNNRGEAHENGSVESPHGHLKTALDQALLLRGSRDFDDLGAYRRFVAAVIGRRNARRKDAVKSEAAALQPLPTRRTTDYDEASVTVTSSSGFVLRRVFYTVPSQLIGHRLKVRIYDDRLEVFLGTEHVLTLARGWPPRRGHGHVVDYRHVIHSLKRKPGALANLTYRDALLPGAVWRRSWEALTARLDVAIACRTMVGLLALAHEANCERALGAVLAEELDAGRLPDPARLRERFAPVTQPAPEVKVRLPSAASYDALLPGAEEVRT